MRNIQSAPVSMLYAATPLEVSHQSFLGKRKSRIDESRGSYDWTQKPMLLFLRIARNGFFLLSAYCTLIVPSPQNSIMIFTGINKDRYLTTSRINFTCPSTHILTLKGARVEGGQHTRECKENKEGKGYWNSKVPACKRQDSNNYCLFFFSYANQPVVFQFSSWFQWNIILSPLSSAPIHSDEDTVELVALPISAQVQTSSLLFQLIAF